MRESKFKIHSRLSKITLDERAQLVLKTIIHLFISTAQPISSRTVAKYLHLRLNLSPASIRNIMAELEDYNLIDQPHTSSGRIPTDLGYRYYVDTLIQQREPSERKIEIFEREFKKNEPQNIEDVLITTSKVLSLISKYLSIVIIPDIQNIIIEKIDIVPLQTNRLLFVLVLKFNIIRTITIETTDEINLKQLDQVITLVNQRISGKPLNFVYKNFPAMFSDHNVKESSVIRLFITLFDKLFANLNEEEKAKITGTRYLFRYPEFTDPELLKNIFKIIDNADLIVNILKKNAQADRNVTVLIGSETNTQLLFNYSLIATRYYLSNSSGIIGLLGPKRMNYQKVINLVNFTSKFLSQNQLCSDFIQ